MLFHSALRNMLLVNIIKQFIHTAINPNAQEFISHFESKFSKYSLWV